MVLPSLGELLRSAEIGEARERSHVLRIDLEAISQTSADVRGGSGNEILHREHWQWSRLLIYHACPRQSGSERPEQINAKGALPVDYLEQRLALGCVWMNMIQNKPIGEGGRNCVETLDDEVHIVQSAPVKRATMLAQTRFYGETPCECAAVKIMRQELLDNVGRPLRIAGVQKSGEHGQ